jgi:predicted RNA-binding Zn-ribbon protein involved in translation (DUF1610 family)
MWFLVDMHVHPQWVNKHLLPPLVDNKRRKPGMTQRLTALVKRVVELRDAGLHACHCGEEFIIRWIRPRGRRDALAYECPLLADPSHEPADSMIFNFVYCC